MWECSECQVENDLDAEVEEGQIVECLECGAEFEVTGLEPLRLGLLETALDEDDAVTVEDDDDDDWGTED